MKPIPNAQIKTLLSLALGVSLLALSACAELKSLKQELKPEPGPGSAIVTENIYQPPPYRPAEGSLWPGDTSNNLLFGDTKARGVGDVVTVVLEENFTSSSTATTQTAKSSTHTLSGGSVFGLPTDLGVRNFLGSGNAFDPSINTSLSRSNDGSGTTTRNGSVTGSMAAVIKDVLPNGNFIIEGRRTVQVNNEDQMMVLTGVIRRVDITFENTISSTQIADARIALTGVGVVADEQKVGWFTRILAHIWPF